MTTALSICIFIIGFLLTLLIPTIMSLRSYKKEAEKWERLYEEKRKKKKGEKMTGENFLAFIIGMFIGYALVYIGVKTNERLNGIKKKLENKEPLVFDGVDDFVKCGEKGLKDYTVIKGESWS